MRNPDCTLWRGVPEDLESAYKDRVGKTVVFWGYTSTTRSMDALDAFIPADSPQVCRCARRRRRNPSRRVILHTVTWRVNRGEV
jgi:hypothetical protein